MKRLLPLLLCASVAAAQDADAAVERVREALNREAFDEALARADAALEDRPDHGQLRYVRAQAARGVARKLQRNEGYLAALGYLERDLSHPLLVEAYAETGLWAGEEVRALRALDRVDAKGKARLYYELLLLHHLRRYDEAERRAAAAKNPEWVAWARERAGLRERLKARARRGAWVALAAALGLVGAAALLFSLAPRSPPRATS